MSPFQFYNAVKSGGKWDYKTQGGNFQDFGNYNFGVVGRANGWDVDTLLKAAGLYQIYSGTSDPDWDWPWGDSPFGDDPIDQQWILEGVKDYEEGIYEPGEQSSTDGELGGAYTVGNIFSR